jgi:hypothetical protein
MNMRIQPMALTVVNLPAFWRIRQNDFQAAEQKLMFERAT